MRTIRTSKFDISGNSFFRVFKSNILNKLIAVGKFRMGTGFKPGLVLLFLHWFGRPLFRMLIHFEPYLHRLYQKIRRQK